MGAVTMATSGSFRRVGAGVVRAPVDGDLRLVPISFTFSNSYASGGDTGVTGIPSRPLVTPWLFPTVAGYTFKLDTANNKVLAYTGGAGTVAQTQVTAGQDLSALGQLVLFMLVQA